MRRLASAALILAALAPPAFAGEGKGSAPPPEHYVDVSTVALPVVWRGQVVNYVFTNVRLNLQPRADATKLKEREPYLRDALVRAGHRAPFVRPWDFTHVDDRALAAAMRPEAERILGAGQVVSVVVVQQTPKQTSGLPKRPAPGEAAQAGPAGPGVGD
jgi:hypothetical protein